MGNAAFEFQNLAKTFFDSVIFENVNLKVPRGQFVTLLGRSGSGKSTLLRLIAGLEKPSSGQMILQSEFKTSISYVFQDPLLLGWKTVLENVSLPLTLKNVARSEAKSLALKNLKKVGLESAARLFPHQLSGGMKMRVSLARALVTSPQLLLLDEPFAALDESTRFEMQDLLLEIWRQENLTAVFVTHSLFEAAYLSQRVVVIKKTDAATWVDTKVELPQPRSEALRTAPELNQIVKMLSETLRV